MDLYDALADAEAAATEMAQLHADLLAQAESAQDALDDLRLEIDGLKRAIARHERRRAAGGEERQPVRNEQHISPTPPTELVTKGQTDGDWQSLARTEAVEKMLAEVGGPISPMNLSRKLQEVGRSDDPLAVGKALNHLYRKKRATTVGRAKWVLADRGDVPAQISEYDHETAAQPQG